MHKSYWPILIPVIPALAIFILATWSIRKGVIYAKGPFNDGPITRDDNPIQFWFSIALAYLAGLAFLAGAAFAVYKGGVTVQ